MKSIIKSAKSVEDALKEALLDLNVKESDVEVEIIDEPSKGFLGLIGNKEAKIKVTVVNDPIEFANKFLTKVFTSMGIVASNDISIENQVMKIDVKDISHSDMGILIGKRGNTLDSIQYLLSLAINKKGEDYLRVVMDSEGYREKREETLIRLANKMADKAKASSRPVKLEPMNPYERRVIHSTLQSVDGVSTYSEGDEPYRRVVIISK